MNYLKKLYILPYYSQYIFSILLFVVRNRCLSKTNSNTHNFNTRANYDLHPTTVNLTLFKKGVFYSGIKVYNHLFLRLTQLSYDINKFKSTVKKSFYKFLLFGRIFYLEITNHLGCVN